MCPTGLVTVKLSLCLIKHHTIKTWESGSVVPLPLSLALDRGEQSASYPGYFWQTSPVPIRSQAGWAQEPVQMLQRREKSHAPARNEILAVQPIACHYTNWKMSTLLQDWCWARSQYDWRIWWHQYLIRRKPLNSNPLAQGPYAFTQDWKESIKD